MLAGLCLLPGEEDLFDEFPGSVLPYLGMRGRAGKPRIDVISYQMVRSPCPLYDASNKTCTRYDERPSSCRSYPFSHMRDGYSLEQHCRWVKEQGDTVVGETRLFAGDCADSAILECDDFFASLCKRRDRTGELIVLYDARDEGVWVQPVRVE